ncbi:glycosyltransferase family 39 protein [Apilactobacillus kunkeei]|uniref:glycosyltransferase family 39 protein n=1 Tax=Apilactobacillus kunkeei TaxID=148814 RepID=UPI00110CEB22|nr:glycosyltransferase family 39 protein [Apilactobacillus kunkeei]TMT01286.1 glycosyltransferase family 39 protein [Apilactobacillus kunkeei]
MKVFVKKHINCLSICFLILISVAYMKLWFSVDENFSLNLVNYNFKDLLYWDSIDVHPPLYYIFLKVFLSPFHGDFIQKMILSRVFSLITSLIAFVYIKKIINYFEIKIKWGFSLALFLIIPNVIGIDNMNLSTLMNIRMYSMASMFVAMTFYYLLRFKTFHRINNLILTYISAVCASYTHYYSAFMVGILLISYLIVFFRSKEYKKSIYILICGFFVMLSYVPWVLYGMTKQFRDLPYSQPFYKFALEALFAAGLIILFCWPCVKLYRELSDTKKVDLLIIIYTNLIVLGTTSLYSLIKDPIFLFRYIYPSLIIIELISYSYCFNKISKKDIIINNKVANKIICFVLVFGIPAFSIVSFVHEVVRVVPISAMIYKNDRMLSEQKGKDVNISYVKNYIKPYDINHSMLNYDVQYSMFIHHEGRKTIVNDKKRADIDNGVPNAVHRKNVFYVK